MTRRPAFDLALHIGAGADADVPPDLAGRCVFVEPDPKAAKALRARMAGNAAADVLEAAIAGESCSRTLYVFNLPGYASLRPAAGLRRLFPGLETVRAVEVRALTPSALLSELDPPAQARVLLTVDAPGEEAEILKGLLDARGPEAFAEIRFRCGEAGLYEGSTGAETICGWLEEAGFELDAPDLSVDPDRPMRIARPDHAAAARTLRTLLSERDAALRAAEARRAELEAELTKAHEALSERDRALEDTNTDLSLGLRLQSLREEDLKQLQQRYAKLVEENERQAKLLRQLTERLSAAAYYLDRLDASEGWSDDLDAAGARPALEKVAGKS